ncbi:MAG: lamin tail domain-containing protein [Patescibacteria group bacterium]|jgi:hypothetical protein
MWGKTKLIAVIILGIATMPAIWVWAEDDPAPSVIINEVAWAGSTKPDETKVSDDEWIELRNLANQSVDLTNWQLTKNTGTSDENETRMLTLPANSIIEAKGYFLISRFDIDTSMLNTEPNVVVKRDVPEDNGLFSLSNTKLRIGLYSGDYRLDENLVDVAGALGKAPFAGDSDIKASMERNAVIADGQQETSWHSALASINFDSGVADLGTPMASNSIIVEPPILTSITPAEGEVGGILEIESICGDNFSLNPIPIVQIRLGDIKISADNVRVADPTLIDNGQFSLDGAETGRWDLVVTNPDGQTATLSQIVKVTEPPPEYDLGMTVRINEVYPQPNTTSNDEFIELYNFGDQSVNLTGWILDDMRNGGSSPLTLEGRVILPKQYLTLYKPETKLTLNDNGDAVYLIQPNGFELDRTEYTAADRGWTWARFDDGWKWTSTPTANGKNVSSTPPVEPETEAKIDEPDDPQPELPTFTSGNVLITELLPNPKDNDEFIELYNATNQPIDLSNWTLKDKSGRKYTINDFAVTIQTADGLIVQDGQYVVITQTMSNLALNNTGGETVTLLDPTGKVIATVSYPDKAPVNAAYVLEDGVWTWTPKPTPGKINVLALDEADEPAPQVDIVLPDSLPVTGETTRRWWGIGLVSLALGAVVCLVRREKTGNKSNQSSPLLR